MTYLAALVTAALGMACMAVGLVLSFVCVPPFGEILAVAGLWLCLTARHLFRCPRP
jgi:hypothetical protein